MSCLQLEALHAFCSSMLPSFACFESHAKEQCELCCSVEGIEGPGPYPLGLLVFLLYPAWPKVQYDTIIPMVLVCKVMQDFYHQQ